MCQWIDIKKPADVGEGISKTFKKSYMRLYGRLPTINPTIFDIIQLKDGSM